jgi:hypothetical protein
VRRQTGGVSAGATPVEFGGVSGTVSSSRRVERAGFPGGCVAVLLPHGDVVLPVDVITAAKKAGLSYLQHIVAADRPPRRGEQTQLDIHTDVLILTRSSAQDGGRDG